MERLIQSNVRLAAIQMVSTMDVSENIDAANRLVGDACEQGAEIVLLPEYWVLMAQSDAEKINIAEPIGDGPIQSAMAMMAKKNKIWLIGGTVPLVSDDPKDAGRVFNSTLVYNPQGVCVTQYNKMHLFNFTHHNESYDESRTLIAGTKVSVAQLPIGNVGLSICYDLRFPELYRAMGDCALIVVPSAFTYTTGKMHWEVLLRARAIENQCYVLAAAQGGLHTNGRRTWGHSMLINPWGSIEAQFMEGEGVVIGDFNPNYLTHVRTSLPALTHRRI